MDSRLAVFEEKMGKSLANLEEEFAGIRAGRANPHVLDKLRVDYYGTPSPIQSVANVSVPEPRMIQIQPWEASMVKEIEKAIMCSDLGINPTNVLFQHGHELALLGRADEDQIRLDCQDLFHIDAIDRPHFRYVLIALGDRRVSGADRRAAHEICRL